MMPLAVRLFVAMLLLFYSTEFAAAASKVQKNFDGWQVDCAEGDQGKKACAIFIVFVDNKSKAVVLGWSITANDQSPMGNLVVRTLTGVDVSKGIVVKFDGSKPVTIPYKICLPQYCATELPFTDPWLNAMRAAKKFTVVYSAANGKEVQQEVDLQRFSEAFKYYASLSKDK